MLIRLKGENKYVDMSNQSNALLPTHEKIKNLDYSRVVCDIISLFNCLRHG